MRNPWRVPSPEARRRDRAVRWSTHAAADVTSHHIPSPHISSHHVASHRIASIASRRVASHRVELHRITSHHTATRHGTTLQGYETILESINDPDIEAAVKGAMQETAGVLIPRYNLDPEAHADYIERTIARFRNPHIKDTVKRVGRDPLRKLEPTDRLVAPITWATEEKLPCTNLCRGLAAALRYSDEHDQQALRLQSMLHSSGLIGVLKVLLSSPYSVQRSSVVFY